MSFRFPLSFFQYCMHGYMYSCINMYCMSLLFVIFLFSFFSISLYGFFLLFFLFLFLQVVCLNFSSATTSELLLKTFDHYCEYKRTPNRVIMAPAQLGKWLVLFCDGINYQTLINMVRGRGETRQEKGRKGEKKRRGREAEKKVRKEEGGDN